MKGGATVDKPKSLYLVKSSSGRALHVWATSSNQAGADRDTLVFIKGMLEIGAKAYAERGCAV